MPDWLPFLAVAAIALAGPSIVGRLWRSGRVSREVAAATIVGRYPVLVGVIGLLLGVPPWLWLLTVVPSVVIAVAFYRPVLGTLEGVPDQARDVAR
jgi:hypothetical protein